MVSGLMTVTKSTWCTFPLIETAGHRFRCGSTLERFSLATTIKSLARASGRTTRPCIGTNRFIGCPQKLFCASYLSGPVFL